MSSEPTKRLREQLDGLLSETIEEAIERERSTFDDFAGTHRDAVVLFGARRLGRKTLAGLRSLGIDPLAFGDNDPQTWGTVVDGLTVYSPQDAVTRFGSSAVFVVTIWGRGPSDLMALRCRALEELGCSKVISFVPLFWRYASTFLPHNALALPHFVLEKAQDVRRCFEILADQASKTGFVEQVKWRVTGDFDALSAPVSDEIYFPDFIDSLERPETFIDCGAYDGDTVLRFLVRNQNRFEKAFAFEPDPANFRALEENISRLPDDIGKKIEVSPFAVGAEEMELSFAATGTLDASFGEGSFKVQCVRLDDVLKHESSSYIKMDIEAAEPDAIRGAAALIKRDQPVVAACSYHVQDHLWTIPLLLFDINPDLAIVQRQHIQLVEDLVTYAVPYGRFLDVGEPQ